MTYVNRGPDPRILGAWAGRIQSALSFKTRSEPIQVLVAWPPFVSLAIPYPRIIAGTWRWRYATVRVGWRYDKHWGDTLRCEDIWSRWEASDQFCEPCLDYRPWDCQRPKPQPNRAKIGGYILDVIIKLRQTTVVHY